MSRADPFAFFRALKALGIEFAATDPAKAKDLHQRPRPLLRQLERKGFTVETAKPSTQALREFGFKVATVFDVGVDTGTPLIYDAFPDAKFVLIDPVLESRDRVSPWKEKIDFDFFVCGVGAAAGRMQINIPMRPGKTNLARASLATFTDANASMFTQFEQRDVEIRTLDSIAQDYEGPFGLKIDTEGFELEVIKGARAMLTKCEFVIAEVSVKRRFANGYRFSQFIAEMGERGFEPIDFLRPLRPDAVDCDVLFARYDSHRFDF